MWTFIALDLHQLTDSKVQLNKTNVNNHNSNNLAGLLPKRHGGERGAMMESLLQTGKI